MAVESITSTIADLRRDQAVGRSSVAADAGGDRPGSAPRWRKKTLDVASTLASSFFLFAVTAIQAILLARTLGPEGRGEFAAAISYTRLLTYIGLLGINYVIVRRAAQAASGTSAISRAAVRTGALTGLGTMVVVIVLSSAALPADKRHLAWLAILCATTLPLEHMRLGLNAVDQGSGRMARFNAGRIVAAAAFPLLLVIAWLTCGITVVRATCLLIPAAMIGLIFRLAWNDDRQLWRAGAPSPRVLLREARPYALSVIASDLFNRLDTILILWLADFSQQGLYVAAVAAVQLLAVAPEALAVFAFNAGAKQRRPLGVGRLLTLAIGAVLAQALMALLYWTVLAQLVHLVYGKAFDGAVGLATALLPGLVFQGCTIIADGYMRGRGRAGAGIWARLAGAAGMGLAACWFFAPFGGLAVPLAASVGNATAAVWLTAAMIREALGASPDPAGRRRSGHRAKERTMSEAPMVRNMAGTIEPGGVADADQVRQWAFAYTCLTPLLTAVSLNPSVEIGGFNLSGWLWVSMMVLGIGLLWRASAGEHPLPIRQPCRHWLAWLGMLWLSIVWCDDPGRSNVQQACQMSMPLLVAAIASLAVRSEADLRKLLQVYLWSVLGLAFIILGTRAGVIQGDGLGNRDTALSLALVGCIFLARGAASPVVGYAGWLGCIGLILLSSSRMAAVALVVVIVFHPLYKGVGRRLLAVAAMIACGIAVFYSPMFQQRTFYAGEGSLSELTQDDAMDSAGRFFAWPLIWDEAWKRPMLGAGVGSSREFVMSVWPGVSHPHNDYLRVGFECGLLGLAVYLAAVILELAALGRQIARTQGLVQQAFAATLMGFLILLFTSATDNTIVYNISYTDPLFVLMGGAYGAAASLREVGSP